MRAAPYHQQIARLINSDLKVGERIQFTVTSNSMQPIMQTGDSVTAEVIAFDKIKRGDILVIQRDDGYLTHRAILSTPKGWLTKGDNNTLTDPPTPSKRVVGRVIIVEQAKQKLDLQTRQWTFFNPLLAELGKLETAAFLRHRYLRFPFRITIRLIHKALIRRVIP